MSFWEQWNQYEYVQSIKYTQIRIAIEQQVQQAILAGIVRTPQEIIQYKSALWAAYGYGGSSKLGNAVAIMVCVIICIAIPFLVFSIMRHH